MFATRKFLYNANSFNVDFLKRLPSIHYTIQMKLLTIQWVDAVVLSHTGLEHSYKRDIGLYNESE